MTQHMLSPYTPDTLHTSFSTTAKTQVHYASESLPLLDSNAGHLDSVHAKPWYLLIMSLSTCPQPSPIYEE